MYIVRLVHYGINGICIFIQMKIDKLHGNEVTYKFGAIENPKINKIIVDILLEGIYPAFHNRNCTYFDKSLKCR